MAGRLSRPLSGLRACSSPGSTGFIRCLSTESAMAPALRSLVRDLDAKELRSDVNFLGWGLGDIIRQENQKVYDHVESLRKNAKAFRFEGKDDKFAHMVQEVRSLSADEIKSTARSFAHFMALSNCAETHHRVREMNAARLNEDSPFPRKEDSCRGAIEALLAQEKMTPKEVREALMSQRVELVLTAHPTEINRRTMLMKHRRVREMLDEADRLKVSGLKETSYEIQELERKMQRELASIWASDELRRVKPTPMDEARGGLAVVESVLWHAVPSYLRKLDFEMQRQLGGEEMGLPLEAAPIRFASWMAGDRDGNPNVSPEATMRVCAMNRWRAAALLAQDISELYVELSMSKGFSPDVVSLAAQIEEAPDSRELYRRILYDLHERLNATARANEARYRAKEPAPEDVAVELEEVADVMIPLRAIHESLLSSGHREIAKGNLEDAIRRLAVFGLTIVPLDVRQESTRHMEAVDAITQMLGLGSYAQWTEDTKINWLCQELSTPRPLLPHGAAANLSKLGLPDTVVDTLDTVRVASQLGAGSLGAYVISQARAASDVLAVALLQKEFDMKGSASAAGEGGNAGAGHMLRVVPLFETLSDLDNAPGIMERLFSLPAYTGRIDGRQEIMVGYSDSAKDAGRLAATWAQYRSQEQLAELADKFGIELSLFHGKGGTVGRGGSPAVFRAVLAHPPNTINGRFRITEQGEMITQSFGNKAVAELTLDTYTAAVLREKRYQHVLPKKEWREALSTAAEASCAHYRKVVRETPVFVPFFRTVTPELELGKLNIGSRPAKRNPKGGVESLRAIPWIFSWSQTRCHLPAWLGVAQGLQAAPANVLHEMYTTWPWFREIIDLIAMVLAKADTTVAANYDAQLISDKMADAKELRALGVQVRQELEAARAHILEISGKKDLNMDNAVLARELEVRSPYLDSLNVMQAEVMRRLRNGEFTEEEEPVLQDALLTTITGLAAGLRNSG